ncbi:MAG: OmpA family protein [Muribaculaceae bacterium]|nr:OmpA family protein [Muribaculaceae bacterium]
MKKFLLSIVAVGGTGMFYATELSAQETYYVEEDVVVTEVVPCDNHYYSTSGDNWFLQIGAGMNLPMLENYLPDGDAKRHITAAYNVGFGKWMSPYLGWRISGLYGAIHWDNQVYSKAKYVNANFDLMWDMFNSVGGVNTDRVFSIVPFVGLGATYTWDFNHGTPAIRTSYGDKPNTWTMPVSAGLQFRFRLSKYVDFFAEGRAQFYGDNFNNYAYGEPIDVNITAIGGITYNIGGSDFKNCNPCDYVGYINTLNNQVNEMRGELALCAAALAKAESQLPCPDIVIPDCPETDGAVMMSTVHFAIDSYMITDAEMVNVYNVAQWLKANPDEKVVIMGYADKNTGSSTYNMELSKKRAQQVYDILVKTYGIKASRLSIKAMGSDTQPYSTNDWNRIVIFSPTK